MQERRISISFPGAPEYMRLARLASADIASRAGFDYEQVSDFRMGVSELCTMVALEDSSLELEFEFDDGHVRVVGRATPGAFSENDLSLAIVRAVLDDYELEESDGSCGFRASKRVTNPD